MGLIFVSVKLPCSSGEIINHQRRKSQWQRVHPDLTGDGNSSRCTDGGILQAGATQAPT